MNKLSNKHFIFFAFVLTVFLGSCKTTTSPNSGTTVTVPGVGSFFVTYDESRDSTNAVTSADTSTDTFVQKGLSVFGKTDVEEVLFKNSSSSSTPDTGYIHYESNGDLSVYEKMSGLNSGWIVYPFGSQGSIKVADTSGVGYHVTATAVGAGQGSVSIKGQSFTTEKVTLTILSSDTTPTQIYNETSVQTIQFAPALGWVVESDSPASRNSFDGSLGDSAHDIIIDYKLY
jgi:hypothetical protein